MSVFPEYCYGQPTPDKIAQAKERIIRRFEETTGPFGLTLRDMERLPVVEQAIGQLITEKQIRPIGVSRRRPADFELDVGQSDDTFLFERVSLLERIVMPIIRRALSDGELWWTREQIRGSGERESPEVQCG